MKVKLLEDQLMLPSERVYETVWFKAGELFDVVETKVMKHDNKEWYKLKSHWLTKPLHGWHNPDDFEIIKE